MNEKTLGQIAYEAEKEHRGLRREWLDLPPAEHYCWEVIAQAVAQAVAPLPEVGHE